jgi:hypothetical protein
MIAYDIKCKDGHVFEGWFKDIESFEEQNEKKMISCPLCGSSNVERIPSTFAIGKKTEEIKNKKGPLPNMTALMEFKKHIEKHFEDVGARFAEEALKIHNGEVEERNIRGTTTDEEEKELKEEGVPFVKIPIMRFDS